MSDWIDFAEVRAKASLEEVLLGMYGLGDRLKRHGKKLIGPCPIHRGDGSRAFQANLEKQVFFCFSGCRRGGNVLDLVAALDGISIREAALKLRAAYFPAGDVPPAGAPASSRTATSAPAAPSDKPAPARAPPAPSSPRTESSDEANTPTEEGASNPPLSLRLTLAHDHPHLKNRGLSPETVTRFGVGYCARGLLRGTIAIPIHDEDGELVAYAGRRLKNADIREHGKYRFPKNFRKDRVLYNLARAKALGGQEGLIVVEGFFAVMLLAERGLPNAVASMGCSLSAAQADLLAEHASHVTILYDGDESGHGGGEGALALLEARHVAASIVRLPEGWKPEHTPARLLRWAVQGARLLSLRELQFTPTRPAETSAAALPHDAPSGASQ